MERICFTFFILLIYNYTKGGLKMKKLTSVLIICLILTSSIGFLSCINIELTVDKIINSAIKNAQTIKNYDLVMDMVFGLSAKGQSIEVTSNTTGTAFMDPQRMKLDMKMNMLGQEQDVQIYAEEIDKNIEMYTYVNGSWQKTEFSSGDMNSLNQYDMKKSASLYLENAKNFTQVGIEKVNDKAAYKMEGTMDGASLAKVFASIDYLDSLSSLGVDSSMFGEIFKDMDDMKVTIWIDKGNLYPVKFDMDMSAVLAKIMDIIKNNLSSSGDVNMDFSVEKFSVISTISNINTASNFDIPPEAKI